VYFERVRPGPQTWITRKLHDLLKNAPLLEKKEERSIIDEIDSPNEV
jgi:hypothetical protein